MRVKARALLYAGFTEARAATAYTAAMAPERPRASVLVVEDELPIREGVCDVLAYHGFAARGVGDGEEGLRAARDPGVDLLVLDLMLPGLSGLEVCRRVRGERPELPVLILTARGAEEDVLEGFACGADDYVTKPFSVAELVARIEALWRRASASSASEEPPPEPFGFAGWKVDPRERLAVRGRHHVELARKEIDLLALLARHPGRILSRRLLLREVWGARDPDRLETRTVDVHVAALRRKLGSEARRVIETVRGEGYRYRG